MADKSKDVIYIDIDDEITSIIDKIRASDGRIIALVLPKRASVFQSIVNMKLLKRSADETKKRLVLITNETGLLPLAGAVGLHVAKTLQSKPEIPAAPMNGAAASEADEVVDVPEGDELTAETAGDKPIGQLAGAAASVPLATDEVMETVELDNEDTDAEEASKALSSAPLPLAAKKDKKLRVPNFERFRLLLILGGLALVALIIFLYFAVSVLPKATIAIKTNASNVSTSTDLTLDTTATSFSADGNVVPAKEVQEPKTYTQQTATTGQVNKGNKATGTVTVSVTCTAPPNTVPAGSAVSSGSLTFITTDDLNFPNISASNGHFVCSGDVPVRAQQGGSQYNIGANSNFAVAGHPDMSGNNSAAFTGGTDNVVKVVAQADIDSAKAKINTQDNSVKQDLQNQLKTADFYAVTATFSAGTPNVTTSSNVGDTADTVTVTEAVTYTMFGAHESDLKKLLDEQIKGQIDTGKQSILDDGLTKASVKVNSATSKSVAIHVDATGVVGPDINTAAIKQAAAGKKSGDIQALIKNDPGVTDVTVKMSPFWVTTAPKKTSKITVTIAKPTTTIKANANNP